MRSNAPVLLLAVVFAVLPAIISASAVHAQDVFEVTQNLDFDDPEAWALKYFTSASLLTSLGAVERRPLGSIEVGVELIQVPHLDREERTVGFGGLKDEDLNRSPVWARLRATVGLPLGFAATVGWVPPVEVDGIEADLVSVALEKRLLGLPGGFSLGARLSGQFGDATGDITCAAGGDELFPPGSPENPFGCDGPSSDTVTLEYIGLELVAGVPLPGPLPDLHFGAAANRLDMAFQVDAPTFGFRDRTRLLADGETISFTAGATWDWRKRARIGVEVFYTDLDVVRRGEVENENDPLINVRALLSYRFF